MSPKQKILAIRLSDKIAKNYNYAKVIGIETNNSTINTQAKADSSTNKRSK